MAIEFKIRRAKLLATGFPGSRSIGIGQSGAFEWQELTDLEILGFEHGYGLVGNCNLFWAGDHDACPYTNFDEIQISADDFDTINWWGHIHRNSPGGVQRQGVSLTAFGLESFLNKFAVCWNGMHHYAYNERSMLDRNAPNGACWTLAQIIADILEHTFGYYDWEPNTYQFPIWSLVYPHHQATMMRYVPMTRQTFSNHPLHDPLPGTYNGPTFRWHADELMGTPQSRKLNMKMDEQKLVAVKVWDVLTTLVDQSASTGIFLDLNAGEDGNGYQRVDIKFQDWDDSLPLTLQCGQRGRHVEDPLAVPWPSNQNEYREAIVIDDTLDFSLEGVETHIIIQGSGKLQESQNIWLVPAWQNARGETEPEDVQYTGKRWRVYDHSFLPLVEAELELPVAGMGSHLEPTEQPIRGPVLLDQSRNRVFAGNKDISVELESGVVTIDANMIQYLNNPPAGAPSNLRLWSKYLGTFRVEAGPGGTAWDNYRYWNQLVLVDEDLTSATVPGIMLYPVSKEYFALGDPYYRIIRVGGWEADPHYGVQYPGKLKDDTAMMQGLADEMLRRKGKEKVSGTVTCYLAKAIWAMISHGDAPVGPGAVYDPTKGPTADLLRRKANIGGALKWANIGLQILQYRVVPAQQQIILTLSNSIDRAINWPYAQWKREWMVTHWNQRTYHKLQEYTMDAKKHNSNKTTISPRNSFTAMLEKKRDNMIDGGFPDCLTAKGMLIAWQEGYWGDMTIDGTFPSPEVA